MLVVLSLFCSSFPPSSVILEIHQDIFPTLALNIFCSLSISISIRFCLSFSQSSLRLEEFIPMVASTASSALTSASDLRTSLVIRRDSYLFGIADWVGTPFFPPLLILITSSFFFPSASFPFIPKLQPFACSLFCLPVLFYFVLLPITTEL